MSLQTFLKWLRIRRRDAIMWSFVWGLALLCVVQAALLCYAVFLRVPRLERVYQSRSDVATNYLSQSLQAVRYYSSAIDDFRNALSSGYYGLTPGLDVSTNAPVVIGRGSVRTPRRIIPYEDVRLPNGDVERRYSP